MIKISTMTSKIIPIILILTLLCILTGCNKKAEESNSSPDSPTPTLIISDDKTEPNNKEDETDETQKEDILDKDDNNSSNETDNNDNENMAVNPKLEDFSELDKYIKDYNFDVSYDENLEEYERTYNVNGEYDLDGDGKSEKISAVLKSGYEDISYIEVNGQKLSLYPDNPTGEIYIIDLDTSDNYLDLAVYDNGPSADPTFYFYRYDGNNLIYIGNIDRYALSDGQGKFISWFHLSNYLTPKFFSAWGEFQNGNYVINKVDVEQYIGKTFEVDATGFFVPMDSFPENYFEHTIWDIEAVKDFNKEKVRLLDMYIDEEYPTLNWYYVELSDGQKGLLYFWIGD